MSIWVKKWTRRLTYHLSIRGKPTQCTATTFTDVFVPESIHNSVLQYVTWYVTLNADLGCETQAQSLPSFVPWSWLCTFRGDCLPYIRSDITDIQHQQDHLALCVCVCEKGKGRENGGSSSDRLAQQIACQCLIWKFFQASHVLFHKPVLWAAAALSTDLTSIYEYFFLQWHTGIVTVLQIVCSCNTLKFVRWQKKKAN